MINRYLGKLIRLYKQLFGLFKGWTEKRSLPGFFRIPIWDVGVFIYNELKRDDITTRANSMAFSFFLSLFPAIIFLFTLIPYIPIDDFETILQNFVQEVMPVTAHEYVFETIDNLRSIQREGLLSVGFVLAFFFASNGMLSMMKGFEKSYKVSFKERNFFKKRIIAIWLTVLLGLLLLSSIVFIVLGNIVVNVFWDSGGLNYYLIQALRWFTMIFLFYSVISSLYRFGPPLKRKFSFFTPGATMATLFAIVTSLIFSYFVDRFGSYSRIYGSLGALIVTLIWMQLNCFIILAGFELNASIAVNRDLKRLREETENSDQ